MEKIQQAIEKARSSREASTSENVNAANTAANIETDVSKIQYTRTQQIDTSVELQRENRIVSALEHNTYADSFKILSTQVVQRMDENHWKSLAITGVTDNAGTTTTAINLGISIAREIEYTVLLVDANLRQPSLHKTFGIQPKYGLTDYLQGNLDLSDILIKPENIDHFVLLPAGDAITNSSEMLGSPRMCTLVEELKERYPKRIVLFDLPQVLGTADTLSFVPCVDATLLVIEDDVTREADMKTAIDYLSVTNIIGTVLNKEQF